MPAREEEYKDKNYKDIKDLVAEQKEKMEKKLALAGVRSLSQSEAIKLLKEVRNIDLVLSDLQTQAIMREFSLADEPIKLSSQIHTLQERLSNNIEKIEADIIIQQKMNDYKKMDYVQLANEAAELLKQPKPNDRHIFHILYRWADAAIAHEKSHQDKAKAAWFFKPSKSKEAKRADIIKCMNEIKVILDNFKNSQGTSSEIYEVYKKIQAKANEAATLNQTIRFGSVFKGLEAMNLVDPLPPHSVKSRKLHR